MTLHQHKQLIGASAPGGSASSFSAAVRQGLAAARKSIPPKFFYDAAGSLLFERICELPEYYPTRTEMRILLDHAGEIARFAGSDVELVELGSGASLKTRILLDALSWPKTYMPFDISQSALSAAAGELAGLYPDLKVEPVAGDFAADFRLRPKAKGGRRLLFFPGSTIGNLEPSEAIRLLRTLRLDGDADGVVVGVDLRKDVMTLLRAYDDAQGVTAAFNLNLLRRINRELGGTFDLSRFRHRARYRDDLGRIEMHLVSLIDQAVRIEDYEVVFSAGEPIHTENAYKYTVEDFQILARLAGWLPARAWTDRSALFSVHLLAPTWSR